MKTAHFSTVNTSGHINILIQEKQPEHNFSTQIQIQNSEKNKNSKDALIQHWHFAVAYWQ